MNALSHGIAKLNDCNYSGKNCGRIYICIVSIACIYFEWFNEFLRGAARQTEWKGVNNTTSPRAHCTTALPLHYFISTTTTYHHHCTQWIHSLSERRDGVVEGIRRWKWIGKGGRERGNQVSNLTLFLLLGIYTSYTLPYQIRILSFLFRFFIFYKFLPFWIYHMSCLELSTLFYLAWR